MLLVLLRSAAQLVYKCYVHRLTPLLYDVSAAAAAAVTSGQAPMQEHLLAAVLLLSCQEPTSSASAMSDCNGAAAACCCCCSCSKHLPHLQVLHTCPVVKQQLPACSVLESPALGTRNTGATELQLIRCNKHATVRMHDFIAYAHDCSAFAAALLAGWLSIKHALHTE